MICRLSAPAVSNVVAIFIRVCEVTFLTQGQSCSKAQQGLEPAADWFLLHYPAQWTNRDFIHLCFRSPVFRSFHTVAPDGSSHKDFDVKQCKSVCILCKYAQQAYILAVGLNQMHSEITETI